MRRVAAGLVTFCLLLVPAVAQESWQEFRSSADGFSVSIPRTPVITSRRIGTSNATQTNFLAEVGDQVTYLISVIQLEPGKGNKNPDLPYFQNLMKSYAEGSGTVLRTSRLANIAGQRGMDGITEIQNSSHQVQLIAAGDRLYMLVYVGPKGQEQSADPTRFRASFKLIKD